MTQSISHPLAWKIYSVFIIVVDVVTIILGGLTLSNLATGVIPLVLCVPLLGYSWQRPLGARWLGKIAFFFGVIIFPILLAFSADKMGVLVILVIYLLCAPYFYASFLFGYRSEHLWSNRTPQNS